MRRSGGRRRPEKVVASRRSDSLQEAVGRRGVGDVGVAGVAVGGGVEVALAAAVVQRDALVSGLVAAPGHALNTGALHL